LAEELRQAKGEIRTLRDEQFGRKSEKATQTDRSNDLLYRARGAMAQSSVGGNR